MPVYPPTLPTWADHVAVSHEREQRARQDTLNVWLSSHVTGLNERLERMELEVKAAHEVASDLQEKLQTLLSAISEEVKVLADMAPKTMAAAAAIALTHMKDEVEGGEGAGSS